MQNLTKKGELTRTKIFDSAIELIHTNTYEKTSMKDICAKSGVGMGTIYHYFKNKKDILHEYVKYEQEQIELIIKDKNLDTNIEKIYLLIKLQFDFFGLKKKNFLAEYAATSIKNQSNHEIFATHKTVVLLKDFFYAGEEANEFVCVNGADYTIDIVSNLLIGFMISWATTDQDTAADEDKELHKYYENIICMIDILVEETI